VAAQEDLHHHALAEAHVRGLVDGRRAALTHLPLDAIAAEAPPTE
jgi:hypothetical protein